MKFDNPGFKIITSDNFNEVVNAIMTKVDYSIQYEISEPLPFSKEMLLRVWFKYKFINSKELISEAICTIKMEIQEDGTEELKELLLAMFTPLKAHFPRENRIRSSLFGHGIY